MARKLQSLHPECGFAIPDLPDNVPFAPIPKEDEFVSIWRKKIANGASPGRSGFTGDHGLPLLEDPVCLRGLMEVVQRIRNGTLDENFKPLLLSCPLIGIEKKGPDTPLLEQEYRPIAIGETLYKDAALLSLSPLKVDARRILGDDQFAFQSGGAETASILLKALLEERTGVACDLRNAFNSIRRDVILRELFKHQELNQLFRIAHWAYSSPTFTSTLGLVR